MFSRSDKTEEAAEAFAAEPEGQRSPMVLAALAGLLAIAGAFLLVWYVTNGQDDVADGDGETATASSAADRQVLVVTQMIPSGTAVTEILESPTVYLSARAMPEEFIAATAITSIPDLQQFEGFVLGSDALPDEQLLRGRFINPSEFSGESLLERTNVVDVPEGHHAVTLTLGSSQALGGNLNFGENVAVVANFRVGPPGEDSFEMSTVVLNTVEVLRVDGSLEVAGQQSDDINAIGQAARGSVVVTLAVEPDELTDLTFAMNYGDIVLATALPGVENDDLPRAATTMAQIAGADGVWLEEPEDGNVIDFTELFAAIGEQGESIEVELPDSEDSDESPAAAEEEEPADEPQPGDS